MKQKIPKFFIIFAIGFLCALTYVYVMDNVKIVEAPSTSDSGLASDAQIQSSDSVTATKTGVLKNADMFRDFHDFYIVAIFAAPSVIGFNKEIIVSAKGLIVRRNKVNVGDFVV